MTGEPKRCRKTLLCGKAAGKARTQWVSMIANRLVPHAPTHTLSSTSSVTETTTNIFGRHHTCRTRTSTSPSAAVKRGSSPHTIPLYHSDILTCNHCPQHNYRPTSFTRAYPVKDMILSPSGRGCDMCGFDLLCKGTNRSIGS